jgi:hypothetical protein
MNDNDAYELAQHAYAAIMWILRYIDSHNLTFEQADRIDVLDFHIDRIDAIFQELEHPAVNDPTKRIVSDLRDKFSKRQGQALVIIFLAFPFPHAFMLMLLPNALLQQHKPRLPNGELTLPTLGFPSIFFPILHLLVSKGTSCHCAPPRRSCVKEQPCDCTLCSKSTEQQLIMQPILRLTLCMICALSVKIYRSVSGSTDGK